MMGSALPAFAADGDASLEIAISSQGANAQESGKRFDYSVSFSCSSVGATGATSCDDGVVYIPINPNLPSTVGAVKMPDWVYSVTAADSTLVAGSGVETVSDSLLKVTLARPLAAGENASFRLEVTPPNGTTPNNTTWTLQPRIESSNAGVGVAPTAASRTATAASKIILEKTTGGTPATSDPKNGNGYPEGYVSYSIKFVAGGGPYGVIGPAFGSDLVITDTLPAQVDYVSSSVGAAPGVSSFPAGVYDAATHTVTYTVSAADFDAQHLGDGMLTIKAKIKATAVLASRFTNTASLSYQPGGAGTPTTLTSSANTTVVQFTGARGFVSKFPDGQGGQVGTQLKLNAAYLASESSTLAGYRINLSAVLPARFAITDPIPCLANPLLGDMLGGGFVSRGVAGHCTNPALLVDELRLKVVGDPANQAPSLPVRLTHTNGTIRDVVVPKNGTLDLGPSRGRIAKVEVLNFLLEDPSYKYTLSVMGRIPDLPQFESGSLLRNNLHVGISLPGAAPTVGAQVHDMAYLQVLRSTYAAGVTNNETVYREVGTVFQTQLDMLFAFAVVPHHTFTSDDMGNKRRKGWLLPVGAVMVPHPSAPPFPGTQIENFEGTGRTLIVLEGADRMSTPYPVSFTGLQPGVYTTDVYSGFAGTNLENCSNPSNVKINDHPELLGGTVGDGTTVCRGQHTLIITSLTPGVSVKKEVRAAGEQEWFGAPGTSRVAGDGASGAEFRISVTNTGPEALKDVVAYDILPHVGDVGSVGGQGGVPRGTTMDPIFVSATVPVGFTAHYSASSNPCRPEVMPTNPGCVSDWSTVLPADLSMVRAIKFVSNSIVATRASYEFIVAMDAPAFSERDVAWNTTAVSAQRLTGPAGAIPPIESPRVGFGKILPGLEVTKAANPPPGTTVKPGDVIDYTLTFENKGSATAEVSWSDLLAEVLDDADLAGAPVSSASTISAANQNGWLSVFGTLAPGASATVTYSVTVRADVRGDNVLTNFVVENPPGEPGPPTDPPLGPGPCVTGDPLCTSHPVSAFTVLKSTTATTTAARGQVVPYTITVTNTGGLAYTAADPASFTDDLSDVLDDAVYNNDATNGATVSGTTLSWSGALAVGESVDISYSVTVNAASTGNDVLDNVVVPDADNGGECVTEAECTTTTPIRSFVVEKAVSATSAIAGDELTYTIMVTNTGSVAYTTVDTAAFTDDLSDVLDNAVYVAGTVTNGATVSGATLSWSGALAVGATQVITYMVKVNDPAGTDYLLENFVTPDADAGGSCVAAGACETVTPIKAFHVLKSTASTELIAGGTVVYTIEVTNTGQVAYTSADPASFTDDLVDVLDDAVYNNDADNGATYAATVLSWSGALAIGETKTITYSVTVDSPVTGDSKLDNVVVTPPGSGSNCEPGSGDLDCEAHVPGQSYTVAKTASETSVIAGGTVTYTITVTNTGALDYTAASPASFTDDLSAVLDDASYNGDVSNGATVASNTLSWSGPLAVDQSETVTYSVTVKKPNTGDHLLSNAVVPTNRGGSCDAALECETHTPVAAFTVAKVASDVVATPGDNLSYTVTVTNTGQVDYTVANPAAFTDDLTAVLDDATYNNDASAGASVTGNTLNWSGALPIGGSVDVTYSVTVNAPATGDGTLTNAVVPDTSVGGECVMAGDCTVTTPVRSFTVQKAADKSVLYPGDTLGYTITVINTGNANYTVADPASFTDDLIAVLDDASYNGDATNGATVTGSTLSWSGALAVGASLDISYTVTVNAPNMGDNLLVNAVVPDGGIGGSCEVAGECETTTPVKSFEVEKTASVTSAVQGDTIVYTITVTNTGEVAYTTVDPASFTDNLADVLDDAAYNDDVTIGATVTGTVLSWSGALPVGGTQTITYSVTVGAPGIGDSVLRNAVVTPPNTGGGCAAGSTDPACGTVTPVASFKLAKTANSTEVTPGETVTYSVTVTNTGAVDYTAAAPASFTDDLSSVLDDAVYNNDADNGASYTAPELSWSGALPVGGSVTVSYSVTINDPNLGDSILLNTVVSPPATGGSCPDGSTNPECTVQIPGPALKLLKTQSSNSVLPGDTVVYTITIENTGAADFTAANPASFSDDLVRVLDDAVYNGDVTGGATVSGGVLSWSGALASGATKTFSYSVTVNAPSTGDHLLVNAVVTPPGVTSNCAVGSTDPDCTVSAPIASFITNKTVDVQRAAPGDVVTYSITVSNTGQTAYTASAPASFTDDLSGLLDDASYNGDASGGATVVDGVLSWSGPLAVGATTVISYSVTVNATERGDHLMQNTVVPDADTGGFCAAAGECETLTPVSSYTVLKNVSTVRAYAGDRVTYTITVQNTGQIAYTDVDPATFTDDLSDVLSLARYNADASGGTSFASPVLSWAGELEVGERLEVSYSVTVNDGVKSGVLRNAVVAPPTSGGICILGSGDPDCMTETDIEIPELAFTGAELGYGGLAALLLTAGGFWLVLVNRARKKSSLSREGRIR